MILPYLKLMRLYYSIPFSCGFVVIVCYLTNLNIEPIFADLAFSFLSLVCVISAGYILNDIYDIEIDKVNCPMRVLPKGQISRKSAAIFSLALLAAGICLAALCNKLFFIMMILIIIGLIVYDKYSKRIGIFKDLLAAALVTSIYPLAFSLNASVQSANYKSLFISPFWLFLSVAGYEMLKDIRDAKGDMQIKNNFTIDHKYLLQIAKTSIISAGMIAFIPFFLKYCGNIYLIFVVVGFFFGCIACTKKPAAAIKFVYLAVSLVAIGALIDLLAEIY